jgi:hypothetical protein
MMLRRTTEDGMECRREPRQAHFEFMKKKISFTEVKTNTHTSEISTNRDDAQAGKPVYERILAERCN